tara:strand:- start:277 stop:654 length:378 start_codon:yes stop_codon:yes gene_type:complete
MATDIRILILEDNPNDAELMQFELKRAGLSFSSEVVETREAYENALTTFKPDIILSDNSLPSFDAITAFEIKQNKSPNTPFIIVSGTKDENADELIKNGIDAFTLKDEIFTLAPVITQTLKRAEG